MRMTEDLMRLTEDCKKEYNTPDSLAHGLGHVNRTANGAAWFVCKAGGTEREQEISYAAGLLHDIKRRKFESLSHAISGSERAPEILKRYSFTEDENNEIIIAIRDHRDLAEWKSIVHQSVYFSDKVFELMGAYMDFRGPFWVGEKFNEKYKDTDTKPLEALLILYEKARNKIFVPAKYPDFARDLVNYQIGWNSEFNEGLKNNEEWAVEMGMKMLDYGRKRIGFEEVILNYEPKNSKQKKWTKEMQDYIKGKKFSEFDNLL